MKKVMIKAKSVKYEKYGFIAATVIILLLLTKPVLSLAPPGTIVRNHAVISFETLTGESYEASSNEVIMIVQPVYGISILPDGTLGSPGQILNGVQDMEMIFPYTLTFTGNVKDTATIWPTFDNINSGFLPSIPAGITGISVYNDLNSDGIADSSDILVSLWLDSDRDGILNTNEITSNGLGLSYDPDKSVNLLVVFNIPANAAAGNALYFGIDGISSGDSSVTDTGNVSKALIVDDAVITISKSSDPVGTVIAGNPVKYTLFAENKGNQAAKAGNYTVDDSSIYTGVLLYDIIPSDKDGNYLPLGLPSPSGTPPAGTIIYSNSDPEGDPASWTWSTTVQPDVKVIGYITSDGATHNDLQTSEGITLTFNIISPLTIQTLSNNGYINYTDNDLPPSPHTVKSNTVFLSVRVIPESNVDIRDTDFEIPRLPKTPDDDSDGSSNDTQRTAMAYAGSCVYFTNRVENKGTINDTFNITLSNIPANWTAVILKSDGISPLLDTMSDNIPDTGVLSPNKTRDIVIRIEIPGDQANLEKDTNIVVTAASYNDKTVTDTTTNIISAVSEAGMNIANTHIDPDADPPQMVNEETVRMNALAGKHIDFPLIVENTAPAAAAYDTYILGGTYPAGWAVVYYLDNNKNARLDHNELTPTLTTNPVPPRDNAIVIARVFIPDNAKHDPDDVTPEQEPYKITFSAASANNGKSDSITNEILIEPVCTFELRPDREGTIEPGGTVYYTHELHNYGSRSNRFYLDLKPGTPNWQYILYNIRMSTRLPTDPNTNNRYYIDLDGAGGAKDKEEFILKIFAQTETPIGITDITSISASARDYCITETVTVVDITRSSQADLILIKTSNPKPEVAVPPGKKIDYTTTFSNKGIKPLSNIIIYEQIPPFTVYILQSARADIAGSGIEGVTFQISTNGGITWLDDNSGSGQNPGITNIRAILNGLLNPGASGSITFQVQIE